MKRFWTLLLTLIMMLSLSLAIGCEQQKEGTEVPKAPEKKEAPGY